MSGEGLGLNPGTHEKGPFFRSEGEVDEGVRNCRVSERSLLRSLTEREIKLATVSAMNGLY